MGLALSTQVFYLVGRYIYLNWKYCSFDFRWAPVSPFSLNNFEGLFFNLKKVPLIFIEHQGACLSPVCQFLNMFNSHFTRIRFLGYLISGSLNGKHWVSLYVSTCIVLSAKKKQPFKFTCNRIPVIFDEFKSVIQLKSIWKTMSCIYKKK